MKDPTAVMCHNIAKYNREHPMPEMTPLEAAKVIDHEIKCVLRNVGTNCNRDCAKCDLVLPDDVVLSALRLSASYLRKIASGEYAPVVHAHLIPVYTENCTDEHDYFGNFLYTRKDKKLIGYRCSNCGAYCDKSQKYCFCGALMGGKDDSHE